MASEVLIRIPRRFLVISVVFVVGGSVEAQRTPLTPVELTRIEYAPGGTRDRLNPETQKWEKVNLDRKIVYDEPTGNFLLQWNGLDGKRKAIVYRPANRLHAVVVARVDLDSTGTGFRYVYALRNLPVSQRELQAFYLEARAPVDNVESPNVTWSSAALTDYLTGVLQISGGWTWAQTGGSGNGLPAGESAYGFSFHSSALPAPVRSYVNVRPGMKGVGEEPPDELMAALDPVAWLVPNGITVGPVTRAENVEPAEFLKEIDAMIEIAIHQGWILSPPLAQELRESVQGVAGSLQQENRAGARATLQAVLKRVEGERDKALLSEAYALLRYNIEFLLSRLEPIS